MLQSVLKLIGRPCTKRHLPSYRHVMFRHIKGWLLCGGFPAHCSVCASGLARGKTLVSTEGVCWLNVTVARVPLGHWICLQNRTRTAQWCAKRQNSTDWDRRGKRCHKEISDVFSLTFRGSETRARLSNLTWVLSQVWQGEQAEKCQITVSHGNCDMPQGCWLFFSFFKHAKSVWNISFACGSGCLQISHPPSNL